MFFIYRVSFLDLVTAMKLFFLNVVLCSWYRIANIIDFTNLFTSVINQINSLEAILSTTYLALQVEILILDYNIFF